MQFVTVSIIWILPMYTQEMKKQSGQFWSGITAEGTFFWRRSFRIISLSQEPVLRKNLRKSCDAFGLITLIFTSCTCSTM